MATYWIVHPLEVLVSNQQILQSDLAPKRLPAINFLFCESDKFSSGFTQRPALLYFELFSLDVISSIIHWIGLG